MNIDEKQQLLTRKDLRATCGDKTMSTAKIVKISPPVKNFPKNVLEFRKISLPLFRRSSFVTLPLSAYMQERTLLALIFFSAPQRPRLQQGLTVTAWPSRDKGLKGIRHKSNLGHKSHRVPVAHTRV